MEKLIRQISSEIFQIMVPLPNNPLKATNSYFIKGKDHDLLIDSGFDIPECVNALTMALEELRSVPERRAVMGTHVHADHIGLLHAFRGAGLPYYLSEPDVDYSRKVIETGEFYRFQEDRFIREGFPPDLYMEASAQKKARHKAPSRLADNITPLRSGDIVDLGNIKLQSVICPGHTPGNSMYYVEKEGILFTGDHILFDISPNITAWPHMGDTLGTYLNSLHKYRDIPVKMALPGHRAPGDYRDRTIALIEHHERRLAETYQIIRDRPGINAYDLTGLMKWNIRSAHGWHDFPVQQRYYAVGECLSHCDHLIREGAIHREETDNGFIYYAT